MNKLLHGTSLHRALKLIENPVLNELNQEKIYFFDTERIESIAGALSFATGDGIRSVNNAFNLSFLEDYLNHNPDVPKGFMRGLIKFALNKAVSHWKKKQEHLKTTEYDSVAAIVECEYVTEVMEVNRKNIVFESYIEQKDFDKIKVVAIFIDQMHREEVKQFLKKIGSNVEVKKIEDLIESIN